MLELKEIKKNYYVGEETVEALKGVSIKFRKNEFVSILGPSGCGKTTMLNIIGGLDRYTSGDLLINDVSTKKYKDNDWDTYRNHSIGFVFQNYNLIPHQTVVENVELALTLSGISKNERRKRAIDVLKQVGLSDKINNKPSQLSGGQMQRVAIARALINDPDIILADEPTGALDTKTSVQIMEILKSISNNKLIIMVTHNPDIANEYSTRIIKLVDGEVVADSNPYDGKEQVNLVNKLKNVENKPVQEVKKGKKNTSMSFLTALSLSFRNLLTKKGRTIMVAFAGSIGIIGIALIMSVSNGFQKYIDKVQEDTLSTYPISLEASTLDYGGLITEMQQAEEENKDKDYEEGYITSNNTLINIVEGVQKMIDLSSKKNNLSAFKNYLEGNADIKQYSSAIQYVYDFNFNIYNSSYQQVNPNEIFKIMFGEDKFQGYEDMTSGSGMAQMSGLNVWTEMLDNMDLIQSQYDIVDGDWPTSYDEIVIIVDQYNQISDYVLYSLGLKDVSELEGIIDKYNKGETIEPKPVKFTYQDILNLRYKVTMPYDYYDKQNGIYTKVELNDENIKSIVDKGIELKVVGILKAKDSASATSINGAIAYTSALTNKYIEKIMSSNIVIEQMANPTINIFTGLPFLQVEITQDMVIAMVDKYITDNNLSEQEANVIRNYILQMSTDEIVAFLKSQGFLDEEASYEGNLKTLGYIDKNNPLKINIYPLDFESKDIITNYINEYNKKAESEGRDDDVITYTDYIGLLLDSITTILDVITYVLIAFVAISLIVSSIMIGVITYISVLERTKEIGILRSIGARKRDISTVFNAETLVIGFTAGVIGIGVTLLLTIPINLIINAIAGFTLNAAKLPAVGAIVLIVISMLLTVVAGLIPAKFAANRDPVEALRTE